MPAQSSRKFSGLPCACTGLWYISLGFPKGIDHHSTKVPWRFAVWLQCLPASHSTKRPPIPASGYRNNSSGSLNNVGSNGYCWSASPNSTNNGHNLNFNSGSWNWNNNNRAHGFPVRPVAEAFAGRRTLPFLNLFTNGHH